jgi:hypothetical protein
MHKNTADVPLLLAVTRRSISSVRSTSLQLQLKMKRFYVSLEYFLNDNMALNDVASLL